jgi:Protoglobin
VNERAADDAGPQGAEVSASSRIRRRDEVAPRRGHRAQFVEHVDAAARLVGWTPEDEACLEATRSLIHRQIEKITEDVYRQLLAHPEMATQFADATGTIPPERVRSQRDAFKQWFFTVVDGPLDELTVGYLASVGHEHVRPRGEHDTRLKARYALITTAQLQSQFLSVLGQHISDGKELARCAAAWCKRLMIHLDLLLAIHSSTERSAHWY